MIILKSEKGQSIVEYVFILLFVAIVVLAALQVFGPTVGNAFSGINSRLDGVTYVFHIL